MNVDADARRRLRWLYKRKDTPARAQAVSPPQGQGEGANLRRDELFKLEHRRGELYALRGTQAIACFDRKAGAWVQLVADTFVTILGDEVIAFELLGLPKSNGRPPARR